jgi:hypothetical protein
LERLRPGQARGVPWFAPVMLKLRDLDAYDEAELVRKREACLAAFVTGVQDEETLGKSRTEVDGTRIETFEPGMIEYLEPGRDEKVAYQPGELLLDPRRAHRIPPPDGGAAVAAAGPQPVPAGLAAVRPCD